MLEKLREVPTPTRDEYVPRDFTRALGDAIEQFAESPPPWASPLGWRLAVMAEVEVGVGNLALGKVAVVMHAHLDALALTLQRYQESRLAGVPHEVARLIADGTRRGVAVDAYARGLEKPPPRPLRPRSPVGRGVVR